MVDAGLAKRVADLVQLRCLEIMMVFVARAYILKSGTNIPQTKIVLVYDKDNWKFVYGALGS